MAANIKLDTEGISGVLNDTNPTTTNRKSQENQSTSLQDLKFPSGGNNEVSQFSGTVGGDFHVGNKFTQNIYNVNIDEKS